MNMKLTNQGLSSREEFKKFIKSIGFKFDGLYYDYKQYSIFVYNRNYYFYNGSGCITYVLDDLTPLEKEFKKELRSIKLNQILK